MNWHRKFPHFIKQQALAFAPQVAAWTVAAVVIGSPGTRALADEKDGPARPLVLADFEDPAACRRNPIDADAQIVSANGGRELQITTKAKASYPGVLITTEQGKWDLAEYDVVKMDVRNPQDVAVRVLLSVNNPGSDGRRNCNTESANVPPRGRATVVVPFGMWHGDPGHPIDQSNVVSVLVLLDRPGRSHRFMVDNIRAERFGRTHMADVSGEPFFRNLRPVFGRGVNLGNAMEAPKEGDWGVVLKEEYFDLIKSAGFDSVRIPVRWSAHAGMSPPYRIDPHFLARVDWAVRHALSRNLSVLVNMHHYDEIMKDPDQHGPRFIALWEQISRHYQDYPAALSLELLNEPHDKLTAEKWNRLLNEAITVVRRTNPIRKIIVGPADWNSIDKLEELDLPADENLVATFHYYSPFRFTHQGANWVGSQSKAWLGTKWLGTKAEKLAIMQHMDKAITWSVKHRRPIFLGEFGAYNKADIESRARWTGFVADEAAARKIGFAYWEFCASFGVYDAREGRWVAPLRDALLGSRSSRGKAATGQD